MGDGQQPVYLHRGRFLSLRPASFRDPSQNLLGIFIQAIPEETQVIPDIFQLSEPSKALLLHLARPAIFQFYDIFPIVIRAYKAD